VVALILLKYIYFHCYSIIITAMYFPSTIIGDCFYYFYYELNIDNENIFTAIIFIDVTY
jgi:hypothetical protein